MNLAQIKGRIKNQLDYTPVPSSALGNYLNSVINDAYYAIWHRRPYLFNQKETNVRVFKDLANIDIYNGGAALGGQSITWTYGSTTATFARAFIQAGDTVTKDKFVGAYIKDPNGVSYAIKNVLSTTSIKLGRPYEGATASSTTFTVYHRFAYLPTDLVEIMDVSFPNFPINVNRSGKAHSIPRRIDVAVDLNQDLVGRKPHYYVPYSKEFANTLSNTLSLVADGSGALVDGDHYFAYSVVNAFHDGTGGNLTDEDTLVFNLTTLNDIQRDEFNRFNEALGSKKIRFFPRPIAVDKSLTVAHSSGDAPNELTFWHLRYTYKPQELADDYDVPSIPSEFHQLIIDRALIDVHAKYDNHTASSAAERRFASRVKALDARYSTERDGTLQRAQSMRWGAGRGTMPVNRSLVYKG